MTRMIVPQLDANTVDVTVTAWRKSVGEAVQAGEIVAELTTDKATFELEAEASGVLREILAAEKSIVPSGYILGLIGVPGETDEAAAAANAALMKTYRERAGQGAEARGPGAEVGGDGPATNDSRHSAFPPPSTLQSAPAAGGRVRATPRARRLAQDRGIDLARVQFATGAAVIDETVLMEYLKKVEGPQQVEGGS